MAISTITGASTGSTGTVITTGSSAAVTQSMLGTNVAGNGPAFSAYAGSATTLTNGAYTKVTFDTEEFDTNNNFASSRFTPTVAGYYQFISNIAFAGSVTSEAVIALYKNGSIYKYGIDMQASGIVMFQGTFLAYANGTTDYFEIYVYQNSSRSSVASSSQTYFQGAMVRSA